MPRAHIGAWVCHLDVDSAHPSGAGARKGWTVRPVKRHVSWVPLTLTSESRHFTPIMPKPHNVTRLFLYDLTIDLTPTPSVIPNITGGKRYPKIQIIPDPESARVA